MTKIEGLEKNINTLLEDQDKLKGHVSARVQKLIMDCVEKKR